MLKLPDLDHIGNHEDALFRNAIFEKHSSVAVILANEYLKTQKRNGKAAANSRLSFLNEKLNWAAVPSLTLTTDDDTIKSVAKLKAEALEDKVKKVFKASGWKAVQSMVTTFLASHGLALPLKSLNPTNEQLMAAISAASSASWWRRQLRTKQGRELEQLLRELGQVSAAKHGYISNHGVNRRQQQCRRNDEAMAGMEAENQYGDVFSLADLAEKTVANPANRVAELKVRSYGFEQIAREQGCVGLFLTLTAPSAYHCMIKKGSSCFRNSKYNGSTPREVQQYFSRIWSQIRAEWDRNEIRTFGLRVAEPHHDGTPHWHMMLFFKKEQAKQAGDIFRKYALLEDGDEKGAKKNRCKIVKMDPAKGSATSYILKYIAKNIDPSGMEGELCDETGEFLIASCARTQAWAAMWGIRQFQQIGGASVSVWRELRKIDEDGRDHWQNLMPENEKLNDEQLEQFEALRVAADENKWADYIEGQGGATVKRNEQTMKPWKIDGDKPTENESRIATLFGVVMDKGAEVVKGVTIAGKDVLSRFFRWEIRPKQAFKKDAQSAASRIFVNNCTRSEGWGYG